MSTDLMNVPVYDALIEAGAGEDKARAAARSVADYDARLSSMSSDIAVLKWLGGANLAATLGVLIRLLVIH
jgi:hypothetical protein